MDFLLSVDERWEGDSCLSWADNPQEKGAGMEKKLDPTILEQSDINIITALALIRQLYLDKKISQTVYRNIKKDYATKIKNVAILERL